MKPLSISLVIPAHNEERYIQNCLNSVVGSSGEKFFEIIVVDNASSDHTAEVAGSIPGVRVVYEPKKGTGWARQRGFMEARGDIVAFIDADIDLPPHWYEMVLQEFTQDPRLACLSGPVFYTDVSKLQNFIMHLAWWCAMPVYWLVGYMAVSANMALRRSVLIQMNGFDTSIPFYGDDTNIARRARNFGKMKFMHRLSIHMSGRRIREQGLLKAGWFYALNFVSQVIAQQSVTKKYKDIR